MTFEKIVSNINYNIKKIVEELRERIIKDIPGTNEVIDKRQIIYQHSGENFCIVKENINFINKC